MTYKIGIFGSSAGDMAVAIQKTRQLGEELGKRDCIVITGACPGLPFEAANVARQKGAPWWGFSPCLNQEEQQKFTPDQDLSIYDKLIYVPLDYEFADQDLVKKKYRNVSSTATCDAGIIISGRWGTLNEFTNLVDMGKIISVLTDTGGVADELQGLNEKIKKGQPTIIFESNPKILVEKLFQALNRINS